MSMTDTHTLSPVGKAKTLAPRRVADILARLRERRPRIHVLTSPVAQTFTANMLLAVGAEPSMTFSPEEVPAFVAASDPAFRERYASAR